MPSWLQANSGWSETSGSAVRSQVKAAKSAGAARSAASRSPCRAGCPGRGGVQASAGRLRRGGRQRGTGRSLPDGAGVGLRVALVPSVGRAAARGARAGRRRTAVGSVLGAGEPVSVGVDDRRGDLLGGVHGPEAQHGGLARPAATSSSCWTFGTRDDDLVVTGRGHLGLADAQAVDPALDDGLGLLQAVRVDRTGPGGVLGGQGDGGAAPQVEPQLGQPGAAQRHQGDRPGDDDRRARSGCGPDDRSSSLPRALVPAGRGGQLAVGRPAGRRRGRPELGGSGAVGSIGDRRRLGAGLGVARRLGAAGSSVDRPRSSSARPRSSSARSPRRPG